MKLIQNIYGNAFRRREIFYLGQLPSHPNHPKGRNPYAHVALCIKNKFNMTYKDIEDDLLNEVLAYIEFLKNNPQ